VGREAAATESSSFVLVSILNGGFQSLLVCSSLSATLCLPSPFLLSFCLRPLACPLAWSHLACHPLFTLLPSLSLCRSLATLLLPCHPLVPRALICMLSLTLFYLLLFLLCSLSLWSTFCISACSSSRSFFATASSRPFQLAICSLFSHHPSRFAFTCSPYSA
jgi:hypothetical protein